MEQRFDTLLGIPYRADAVTVPNILILLALLALCIITYRFYRTTSRTDVGKDRRSWRRLP